MFALNQRITMLFRFAFALVLMLALFVIVSNTSLAQEITPVVEAPPVSQTPNESLQYTLVLAAILVFGALFIGQQLLIAWLAKNNVKLVDPESVKSTLNNFGARILETGYGYARQTPTPADDELLLSWSSNFYDVVHNQDGSVTLNPKERAVPYEG